jgi:hypothetical protein
VELSQSQQLEDLLGLGGELVDTTHNETPNATISPPNPPAHFLAAIEPPSTHYSSQQHGVSPASFDCVL